MAETSDLKDKVRFERGFISGIPLGDQERAGDVATAGRNAIPTPYGEFESWNGLSLANQPAAPLLHVVDNRLAGSGTGNIFKQHGSALYFIGSGRAYYDDFTAPFGTASSLLQIYIDGTAYQASLPAPPAPLLLPATDSSGQFLAGQLNGARSVQLTRVRTVTRTESPSSETSNVVIIQAGKGRLQIPPALTASGQDQWGVYWAKEGRGGIGPHYLFRFIAEADIAPRLSLAAAQSAGDGATATFGGLSSAPTKGRLIALALAPVAASAPVFVGATQALTAGAEAVLRVTRPQAATVGNLLLVAVSFDAIHQVAPQTDNKGTVTLSAVSGIWTDAGSPINPNGDVVEVKQVSQTQFQWRKNTGAWSASLGMAVAPVALGATGLAVAFSAATSGADEVGNSWIITPFALIPPGGWTLQSHCGATDNTIGLAVWSRFPDAADGDSWDWTSNVATQMAGILSAHTDVSVGAPVAATATNTTAATTNHTATFGAAPAATSQVALFFAGEGGVSFTPSAPLALSLDTATSARAVDFDFSDGDLTDIISPKRLSGPPAGTHAFPIGPVTVVAGTEDGTGLNPSLPNQSELYDLTLTTYLNPAEPIVRVETRPQDGSVYLFTENSLQTVIYTGSDQLPLLPRGIWPNVGIANPSGACLSPYGVFAAGSRGGFYRSNVSGPDSSFYRQIAHYVRNWDAAQTVVGYVPTALAMGAAFCHGREILYFDERTGLWSVPLICDEFIWVPGVPVSDCRILSHATFGGALWLSIGNDAAQALHQFGVGPGGDWFLRSAARDGQMPGYAKTLRHIRPIINTDVSHPLTWRRLVNTREINDQIVAPSANVGGFAVSEFCITPQSAVNGYFWTFDFPLTGALGRERAVILAEAASLTLAAAPALAHHSAGAKWAIRVRADNVAEAWKGGVVQGTLGTVAAGYSLRLTVILGVLTAQLLDAGGGTVNSISLGAATFTTPLGIKLDLVSPLSSLGPGRFFIQSPQIRVEIYRNFDAEKGLPPRWSGTFRNSSGPAVFDWTDLNINKAVNYSVQVEGTGGGQRPGEHLIEGWRSPGKRKLQGGL